MKITVEYKIVDVDANITVDIDDEQGHVLKDIEIEPKLKKEIQKAIQKAINDVIKKAEMELDI